MAWTGPPPPLSRSLGAGDPGDGRYPLLSVLTRELRPFLACRLFGIQALCFFVLMLFMM